MCSLNRARLPDVASLESSTAIGEGGTHSFDVVGDGDAAVAICVTGTWIGEGGIHVAAAVGGDGGIHACDTLTHEDCTSDIGAAVRGEGGIHVCD